MTANPNDEELEELMSVASRLTRRYCAGDSTSVSYETAQMLMDGIVYCLNEYRNGEESLPAQTELSLEKQYEIGKKAVEDKAVKLRGLYNALMPDFDSYGLQCLKAVAVKGIPEFLKLYDAEFCPQNTILTLDYPILTDISSLCGIDAVWEYMRAVETEQRFLEKINRGYVTEVMKRTVPGYEIMFENLCSPVLTNLLGHAAAGIKNSGKWV